MDKYLKGRTRPVSPHEAVRMIRGLAHGVSRLHHCTNVIHRDIKLANLILSWEPTRLVLIDFGSAWFAEETAQRHEDPGDGISMRYAAPEQVKHAKSVDFRADQFAVSVIFYELLTLDVPYGGEGGGAGVPEDRATDEPLLDKGSRRIRTSSADGSTPPSGHSAADRSYAWCLADGTRGSACHPQNLLALARELYHVHHAPHRRVRNATQPQQQHPAA